MREESVRFPGAHGELAGRVRRPPGPPRAWAVFAHCFTCGKDSRAARKVNDALAEAGFGVLRFDFAGLGESDGDFARTTFVSNVADVVSAGKWLEATEEGPALLVGHSLGGAAVIAAARHLPSVKAVATLGAPFDPGHAAHLLEPVEAELVAHGEAELRLAGRTLRVGRELLEDLRSTRIAHDLADLGRALLVLHAPHDDVVGVDHARRLFEAARHPKSFVSLDDADHLLSNPADATWAGRLIASWAERYVPARPVAAGVEGVEVHTGEGLRSEVRVGRHGLVADEPLALGGLDEGPSPYDLLLAALGACTGMTLRLYAGRKGWPLDEVVVRLEHHKIHAADCEECETKEGKIDQISRRIELRGALTDEQRARLREMADRCPVHRTLHSEILILTT